MLCFKLKSILKNLTKMKCEPLGEVFVEVHKYEELWIFLSVL